MWFSYLMNDHNILFFFQHLCVHYNFGTMSTSIIHIEDRRVCSPESIKGKFFPPTLSIMSNIYFESHKQCSSFVTSLLTLTLIFISSIIAATGWIFLSLLLHQSSTPVIVLLSSRYSIQVYFPHHYQYTIGSRMIVVDQQQHYLVERLHQ